MVCHCAINIALSHWYTSIEGRIVLISALLLLTGVQTTEDNSLNRDNEIEKIQATNDFGSEANNHFSASSTLGSASPMNDSIAMVSVATASISNWIEPDNMLSHSAAALSSRQNGLFQIFNKYDAPGNVG